MASEELKRIMMDEWQKVRESFHFPSLPKPQLMNDIKNGMFNMESLEIKIAQPFIEGFRGKGIAERDDESDAMCMNECLTHELTHFMRYPGSVLNIFKLQKAAQGMADGNIINTLREAFSEVQTNIYLVNERKNPATAKMRKAYGLEKGDGLRRLMYGLYQEVSGQDFGVKLSEEEKGLVDKLKEINYTQKARERHNFRNFVQFLKDYLPPQGGQEQGGQGSGRDLKNTSLGRFSDNDIREGLRQFARECSQPKEYEKIVKQVLGEENMAEANSGRKGAGIERATAEFAGNFYTARAERYKIPIRKKPMHKNGSLYPHSHADFESGDPITDIDTFSTPKILPGITKKWVRKEGEVYGNEESAPDSFIIIDNSGSMPRPKETISIPVLGGTVISNAYLYNGARVAVYSFGGADILLQPTREREIVHEKLRAYSGGGTVFNSTYLEAILKENPKDFDISIISDMDISNLNSFIDSVLAIPKIHRIHLFYYGENPYINKLRERFGNLTNIGILPLSCEEDINNITMGELKKSIK